MSDSVVVRRVLPAPPDAVFAVFADHNGYDRFAGISRTRILRPGAGDPRGAGAVRTMTVAVLPVEEKIVAFEPGKRIRYRISRIAAPIVHEGAVVELEPIAAGTLVTWTSRFTVPVPVAGPLIAAATSAFLRLMFTAVLIQLERGFACSRFPAG